jgi:hypothetical protein
MAYTTIDDPSAYFQIPLWTGNGSNRSITFDGNSDMQPDWVWGKNRGNDDNDYLMDSVRGATKFLTSNNNTAEGTSSTLLTSFNSDGFSLGTSAGLNASGVTAVGWCWKASGSTASNTDGSTTSTVSANTTAGFSIVSYTGAGATTYGHGLGATPNVIIIKKRTSDTGNNNWFLYHDKVITASATNKSFMTLNETGALTSNGTATTFTSVSSTTFGVGTDDIISESSHTFIAYCFAEKKGYSKFGSYTGNGNADGAFVYTGFKPAWVMVKDSSAAGYNWMMYDNKRLGYNGGSRYLIANTIDPEGGSSDNLMDFTSNGFKLRSANQNINRTNTYIYMAFAENPFVTSSGVPACAR